MFSNKKRVVKDMKLKKLLKLFSVAILIVPLMVGFAGCGNKDNKNSSLKLNAQDVYAISALSSVNFLNHLDSDSASSKSTLKTASATTKPTNIADSDVQGIKNCLGLFDEFVNAGDFNQTTTKNTDVDGEFKDYSFVMTITLSGLTNPIKMYYDELDSITNVELEDNVEEREISTTLQGVMVVEETKFDVSGKREVEQEGDEHEASIEFTTKSTKNPTNYIVISQSIETENNEQEIQYEYKIYNNGTLLQETEIEFEKENDETELEFKLKDLSNGQYNKTIYKLKKATEDNTFLVEYFVDGKKDVITIQKQSDGYTFTYSNGYSESVKF